MADLLTLAVVFLASIIPPIIYLVWVRNAETCQRESFRSVLRAFIMGASLTVGIARVLEVLILQLLFGAGPFSPLNPSDVTLVAFVSAVIVAPIVEELSKAIGVMGMRGYITELEDGLVYGVSVGLGFAAAENMIYTGTRPWTG